MNLDKSRWILFGLFLFLQLFLCLKSYIKNYKEKISSEKEKEKNIVTEN